MRLADALRQGFDVRLGCVCRPNRCHAESIIREVKALAQKRSAEATSGAGPSSEGASAEGGRDEAATRGATDDPPNEQLEGNADDNNACECEGEDDAFQDTVGDETEASGDPTKDEGDPKPSHGLRGRRPYRHPLELATRIGPFGEFALTLGYGRVVSDRQRQILDASDATSDILHGHAAEEAARKNALGMAGQTIERRLRGEEMAEASEEQERRESGGSEEEGGAGGRNQEREPRRRWRRRDAAEQAQRAEEEAAPTSDDVEMERQLEGEADLPTAGGSPRCDPVGDDEDEMIICDAFDEAEGSNSIRPAARGEALDDEAPAAMAAGGEASSSAPGSETVLGRRERGEAFDDEAPTVMAEGGEASSSAPPAAKRKRGRKKTGRKAQMGADQRSDEIRRESRRAGGDRDEW